MTPPDTRADALRALADRCEAAEIVGLDVMEGEGVGGPHEQRLLDQRLAMEEGR